MSRIYRDPSTGIKTPTCGEVENSAQQLVTFTSSDVTDANADSWTSVNPLVSGERHLSIFAKISQMFKNVRYLYKALTALNTNKLQIANCSTGRSTAAKVVTLSGFTLETGARILVRFTNTGTSNPSSGNLTLNVNGTGAKTIVDGHTNNTVMTYSDAGYFYNNQVAEFVYDGTYWVYLNRDNNTTYNGSSLKTNGTITGSGTAIADTILANTTMDTALGTLLNNDAALENNKAETLFVANKADIANLNLGNATTNITGSTITKGKYFYLNDNLVRAIVDIANGATFTLDTNYEYVTVGDELVSLKASLTDKVIASVTANGSKTYSQIYNELFASYSLVYSTLTFDELHKIILIIGDSTRVCNYASQIDLQFFAANNGSVGCAQLKSAGSTEKVTNFNNPGTPSDYSNTAAANGTVFKLLLCK